MALRIASPSANNTVRLTTNVWRAGIAFLLGAIVACLIAPATKAGQTTVSDLQPIGQPLPS